MLEQQDLYEQGYYNYWYDADFDGEIVRADAEFDPNGDLVSIIIYELDDGEVGELIREIMPEDVSQHHLAWVRNKWQKKRGQS